MSTKLAHRITKRREKLGLSFAHLAVACDVSEAAVRCWEAGDYRPRPEFGLRWVPLSTCFLIG